MELRELTYGIIGACMQVHTGLGPGLLEACYHNGLYYQLQAAAGAAGVGRFGHPLRLEGVW